MSTEDTIRELMRLIGNYALSFSHARGTNVLRHQMAASHEFENLESALRIALAAQAVGALTPEALARKFHDTYERLAPSFGYETRAETKVFEPASPNGKLMIAVCSALAAQVQQEKTVALTDDRIAEIAVEHGHAVSMPPVAEYKNNVLWYNGELITFARAILAAQVQQVGEEFWSAERAYHEGRAVYEVKNTGPSNPFAPKFSDLSKIEIAGWTAAAAFRARSIPPSAAAPAQPDYRQLLGDLLAVIHRDGGQYVQEHGWEQAAKDAEASVLQMRAEVSAQPAQGLNEAQQSDAEFVRMLLWEAFPVCCGNLQNDQHSVGPVCCGNPDADAISDRDIVALLRERFPEAATSTALPKEPTE